MLPLHLIARPDPDVVDTSLEQGEMALLHLGTKTYFSLNATGAKIWSYLKEGLTLEDVSQRLHQEFEASLDEVQRSVAQLVEGLAQNKLVVFAEVNRRR